MSTDNYTKFPNDILSALICSHLTALQMTVVLYVVRKVNGWGKPSDVISVSRMAKDTGYSLRKMFGAVSDLEKMGILSVERNGAGRLSEMRVNNPENWDKPMTQESYVTQRSQGPTGHRGMTQRSQVGMTQRSQEPMTYRSYTKEKKEIYKDTSQKKEAPPPDDDDDYITTDFRTACAEDDDDDW